MQIYNLVEEIKANFAFRKMAKMAEILNGNDLPKTKFSKAEIIIFIVFYLAVFLFSIWKTQNSWLPISFQIKSVWPLLHLF